MKCPVCVTIDLMMTERQTVEIDYCPQCRGVWLDRGELDKIIERSAAYENEARDNSYRPEGEPRPYDDDYAKRKNSEYDNRQPDDRPYVDDRPYSDDRRYADNRNDPRYDPRKKRRRSFLDDVFDIFD